MVAGTVVSTAEVLDIGRRAGLDACGVARAEPFASTRAVLEERKAAGLHGGMHFTYGNPERSTDPQRALPGARSLFVGARSYRRSCPPVPAGSWGRVARYSWQDEYEPLRVALGRVADRLAEAGWKARVLVDDNALVDREAAFRAGIGWYGKNSVLLLPGRGSWFVLGSVVTDAPLDETGAPAEDGCGSCTRCLTGCPTGALVAPGVVDARRCLAWLLEAPGPFPRQHREALGDRIYGCDECQEVCPPNRREDRRRPAPPADGAAEPWIDLVGLLAMDDAAIMGRVGRWYVARRQARYVRRNALVALGNCGDGRDGRVAGALKDSLRAPDPLVRAHAVWAAGRLGRSDLVRAMSADETDPLVREEIESMEPGSPGGTE